MKYTKGIQLVFLNTPIDFFKTSIVSSIMYFLLKRWRYFILIPVALVFQSCNLDENVDLHLRTLPLETLPPVVHPSNNPYSAEKNELGRILFWDPVLSGRDDVACVSCHHPDFGYAEDIDITIGVGGQGLGKSRRLLTGENKQIRNSHAAAFAAYNGLLSQQQIYDPLNGVQFWTRPHIKSLEDQALAAILSSNSMKGAELTSEEAIDSVVQQLRKIDQYVEMFEAAFPLDDEPITIENVIKAIATFERSLVGNQSRYDRYVNGETDALNAVEKEGLALFFGKANCAACHSGPMFSDFNFYTLGVKDNPKMLIETDEGFTKEDGTNYLFRTPTLRNIELTAPYMHNGMHATLLEVMQYYNEGKSENPLISTISPKIAPLSLNQIEIDAIIAFMQSLTDESYDKEIPPEVPSKLPVGGNIQ